MFPDVAASKTATCVTVPKAAVAVANSTAALFDVAVESCAILYSHHTEMGVPASTHKGLAQWLQSNELTQALFLEKEWWLAAFCYKHIVAPESSL